MPQHRVLQSKKVCDWLVTAIEQEQYLQRLRDQGHDTVEVWLVDPQTRLCANCRRTIGRYPIRAAPHLPIHPIRRVCRSPLTYRGYLRPLNRLEQFAAWLWRHLPGNARTQIRVIAGAAVAAIFLLPFWLPAWILIVPTAWAQYPQIWHTTFGRSTAVGALLIVAAALYLLRRTARLVYGIAEAVIGVAACWLTLDSAEHGGAATALKLAAAVYLIVRGIDNAVEGYGQFTFWSWLQRHTRHVWQRYGPIITA
jgi:hypothetical protein